MCEDFGVTPRTLRFYEDRNLISPRREGTRRLYSKTDSVRLKLILRGKRFGFSLDDIRELLDLYHLDDQQYTQLVKTCELGTARLALMRRRRSELDSAIADLQEQLKCGQKMLAALKPPAQSQ
ncbi:MAG TPA: MerR family DNA-binding transcriptional regulator [Hyphomicrobiales bacterium]|nr:MerR family DNA-binding transcriptional regulator [Hyphomicrobiales bacterium]